MTSPLLVSVLLPSYQHQEWIHETIESVLNQSIANIELIIVDDASSDDSVKIIREYAIKDPGIKFEAFPNNSGAMVALNRCYDLSSGKYIATISSDDIWELDKLEKQVKVLEGNKELDAVFALPKFIDESGEIITNVNNGFQTSTKIRSRFEWMNHFFTDNCICYPTSLVCKECYENIGFFNTAYRSLPDFHMWVRLFYHCNVFIIDETLMRFRIHSYNESGKNTSNIIRCQTEHKQILKVMLEQIDSLKELRQIFPEYIRLFHVDNDELIRYYFGLVLLKQKKPFYHDLAFDILFDEFSKKGIVAIIKNNNLYNNVDLSKQIALSDIYKIKAGLVERKILIQFFGLRILERIKTDTHKSLNFCGIPVFKKKVKVY